MEWGIRELFLALGVLGVGAILGHGLWVRWRDELPLRVDPSLTDGDDELDLTRSELPNGGARVVAPGARSAAEAPELTEALAPPKDDPLFTADAETAPSPSPATETAPAAEPPSVPEQAPLFAGEPIVPRAPSPRAAAAKTAKPAPKAPARAEAPRRKAAEPPQDEMPLPRAPEEVLVVHVLAREAPMTGPALVETVTHYGLRYGDMNIFHHYDASRLPAFSMASAVEPGTFDLSTLDSFETPGVSFFLQLPGPEAPMESFDAMVQVAKALAERFDGELRDEQHSVMTSQTLDYCRQKIRDFQRRQMSRPSER